MDSGCSYHMTPKLDILFDFLECDRGSVQLGDYKECKIRGIDKSYKVKVINGSKVVLSGIRRDNCIYSLDGHAMAGEINASVEEKDSLAQVSHKRLGHISEARLQVLEKHGLFGKKSLAFGKFKEWKQLVENQTGRTVKKLRTDNGLEFYNREFKQLCVESGIARHLTVLGRRSRMEATCTVAYLINRSPSTAIKKKTPMEMWSGHPSDYGMLRIFGCVAYLYDKKKDTLKDSSVGADKSVEELQVEVELHRLNNHTPEEDQTDQEDGDDEDARDQETDQTLDLTDYQLARDRERRTRTKPLRFRDESNMAAYAFIAAEEEYTHEPLTYQEAVSCEDSSKWKVAMKEEMDSLRKNKTWELVDQPAGQKLVSCKWLFKINEGIEGVQNPRYKARLVARGFKQRACIDHNEVFSPIVRHTSIRVILALTACKDYEPEQLDVKTTFLHRNLEEHHLGNGIGDDMLIVCKSKAKIGSTKFLAKKKFEQEVPKQRNTCDKVDGLCFFQKFATAEFAKINNGKGTSNQGGNSRNGTQVVDWTFQGSMGMMVKRWLFRVQNYNSSLSLTRLGMRLVSMNLFDKSTTALIWHLHFVKRFGKNVTWELYEKEILRRFGDVYDDLLVELKILKQSGDVQSYQDKFEMLQNKVDLTEPHAVSIFMTGLKSEIGIPLRMFMPVIQFMESVKSRFGSSKYKDPKGALLKLLQLCTMEDYQQEFEKLMNRVTDIPDSLLISFNISGLKLNLQHELLVSRPTMLGDAFSLARITEARTLDASEDTLLSLRSEDLNFKIQEKAVEYVRALNVTPLKVVFTGHVDEVRDKFAEFFKDKGSVEKVLSATKLPKGGNSHSAYSLYHLQDKVNFEGMEVTPVAAEVRRKEKSESVMVQSSESEKGKKVLEVRSAKAFGWLG
ncbi:retrotransposon protein, putative, ty1-copia subclass [Tanacetum coccineum]